MKRILALDISTVAIGWAVADLDIGTVIESGCVASKKQKLEHRLLHMTADLSEKVLDNGEKYEYAVFEQGIFCRNQCGTFSLGAAQGAVMMNLASLDIPIEYVKVAHWKQVFCGAGNAPKPVVMETCRAMGYRPQSEDEADAIGLAYGAMALIDEKTKRTPKKKGRAA